MLGIETVANETIFREDRPNVAIKRNRLTGLANGDQAYCENEEKLGNKEFIRIKHETITSLFDMKIKCVDLLLHELTYNNPDVQTPAGLTHL